jgi:hypothetical protein
MINTLNHDASLDPLLDPSNKIKALLANYRKA